MGNRSSFWFVSIAVLASAAIAYGLVFWTPWLARYGGWDTRGYTDYGTVTYSPDTYSYSYSYPDSVQELAKRQPLEVQVLVKDLWKDLMKTDEADLFVLKSLPDVCLGEIDCRGMRGKDVKPFVEAALAHKQGAEGAWIARLSLVVAVFAALVSFIGLIVKR